MLTKGQSCVHRANTFDLCLGRVQIAAPAAQPFKQSHSLAMVMSCPQSQARRQNSVAKPEIPSSNAEYYNICVGL